MRLIDADELVAFIKANGYVYANTIESFETFFDGTPKERVRKIARAEAEGRCVVHPVPKGTTLYYIGCRGTKCEFYYDGYDEAGCDHDDCGKKGFVCPCPGVLETKYFDIHTDMKKHYLTRAEAEAALTALDKRGEDA
jgi:hypothetical protein